MSLKLNAAGGGSVTLQEPTTAANVTLNLPADNGTVIYSNASGNVGIGTASPVDRMSLYGATSVYQRWQTAGSGTTATDGFQIGADSNAAYIWNYENTTINFATNNTERARIDSNGNLLVGTASAGGTGGWTFYPIGSGSSPYVTINKTNTSSTRAFDFMVSGTSAGSINWTNTATSYLTSSDYRLKDNVQPMTGALSKVAALKPCTYKWKSDGSDGEGFIAHELAEVVPQCVTGEKDAVDENGNPVYQGIDTSFLVATLTAAIQELKAEVDSLRAQVEAK